MISTETRGQVALITIDRPQRRNALGTPVMKALAEALTRAQADEAIGAIVLGAAPPAFCAGSDLKELATLDIAGMCAHEADTAAIARSIGYGPKPVIAAVEGFALGGGFILATCCDIVVTASNARWHLPEVPNGWLPPWGLQSLLARVGPVRARRLTWAEAPIDGAEAGRLGVADDVVAPGQTLEHALSVAGKLAALPREAVAATKQYFEPYVMGDAERQDAQASRIFAANCETSAARSTLARFKVAT